jgi:antitoxin ParD1/3/4
MATMNISLPAPMREWVETQIEGGRYSNNSDYVRDLIRKDQEHSDKLRSFQLAIKRGFESGADGELDIAEIKKAARKQANLDVK